MDEHQTEQRHTDLVELNETVQSIKKAVLLAFIPIMLSGIAVLIANNFEQKNLVTQVSTMSEELSRMNAKYERTNEKVIVMWAGGEWSKKYHESKE